MDDDTQATALPDVNLQPAPQEVHQDEQSAAPAASDPQPAPRQPGILDRVHALSGGLADLAAVLNSFHCRIEGQVVNGQTNSGEKHVPGLSNDLAEAETNFQRCIEMAHTINAKF